MRLVDASTSKKNTSIARKIISRLSRDEFLDMLIQSVYANSLSTFSLFTTPVVLQINLHQLLFQYNISKSLLDCEELEGLNKNEEAKSNAVEPCIDSTQSLYTYQQTQVRDENDQQYHSTIVNIYRYTSIIRFITDMFGIV